MKKELTQEITHILKHKYGLKLGLATSSLKSSVDIKLSNLREWFDSDFEVIITGDDKRVLNGKPNPDIFLLRWILCILDREISLKHVLWIWDCIFFYEFVEYTFVKKDINKEGKHSNRLNFLDIVCLCMILDLKPLVENSEPSIMLCRFMKFPDEKNIRQIIKNSVNIVSQFNGDIKIWNNDEIKKKVNYLQN